MGFALLYPSYIYMYGAGAYLMRERHLGRPAAS
jgi:hypothetical protein